MAATVRPIMEPPKKATFNAAPGPLSLAAVVVRTLALVAVCMPMKPAADEHKAPIAVKAMAVL